MSSIAVEVWRFTKRHWGLLAALAIAIAIHAPTLRYFFDGDDFVVLGSVEYLGPRQYLLDTLRMEDIVPNWRPLTALVYAVEWELFGLNAAAWRAVNLTVHLASMLVLYALMLRVTRRPAAGAIAAVVFGVSGAHFDTVTYITALPHVLATFFLLSSLWALIVYVQDGERDRRVFALSSVAFVLAFLANEGAFVYAPVMVAAYALFARRWHRAPIRLALHATPFVALAAGWTIFYQSGEWEQLKFDDYYWGRHVFSNYAVYLSWLALPAQRIPLEPDTGRWVLSIAMVAAGALGLLRGPNIVRVAVAGIALALLPFVPVSIWTASRYTYAAVAFFSIALAVVSYGAFDAVRSARPVLRLPAMIAGIALLATVAGLYSWQTYAQDARSGENTDRWQVLVDELRANYSDVPDGTTIYIVDGPWQNPMEQYTWVPSVARALYGDAAAFDLPRETYLNAPPDDPNAVFLEWTGTSLVPVTPEQVTARD